MTRKRICEESIDYYRGMLDVEDWLSEETRTKAVEKLDAIIINAVYPEKWRDYSGLSLDGLGYFDCMKTITDFERAYNVSLLNTRIDHDLWDFDILETNAYYNPQENSINIIRCILGGAFYQEDMSAEELYAGIGTVIGHEISHAFDTNGAQFNANGALSNWWVEEDYSAFLERAQKLIDYYNGMTAFGGYQVQDPHPLHYLRVNATVQQFDQFLNAFGIKEGDGMYLDPADRVLVW